jgi:hypothetical protein
MNEVGTAAFWALLSRHRADQDLILSFVHQWFFLCREKTNVDHMALDNITDRSQ